MRAAGVINWQSLRNCTTDSSTPNEGVAMKKLASALLLTVSALLMTGCARPFEWGYSPAYTAHERHEMIARNWDYEGKQIFDDIDAALLLRPSSRLTLWNVR
jgi:hypothetical protein